LNLTNKGWESGPITRLLDLERSTTLQHGKTGAFQNI
jgi:hypothetical protein